MMTTANPAAGSAAVPANRPTTIQEEIIEKTSENEEIPNLLGKEWERFKILAVLLTITNMAYLYFFIYWWGVSPVSH